MNIEDFRNHCLSLKEVSEEMPFEKSKSDYDHNILVFSIGNKWFCLVNIEVFCCCILNSSPDILANLQAEYDAVHPAYHINHRHWISVFFNQDMPDNHIIELVDETYHHVLSSLPKYEYNKLA
ncbi:MmcQ/YjbR family DNA-binding protein [Prevotella aurantiaca JCM 15754]|uniref:MmcQ/YjbR family DNA-binding protein n=1 Tax=Prevotella aurantiaca TaxID=596085 RepID=UPI000468D8C6|nr:MmcQ/YjbR family DNA-binding protein [Prevotella aurantiaca]